MYPKHIERNKDALANVCCDVAPKIESGRYNRLLECECRGPFVQMNEKMKSICYINVLHNIIWYVALCSDMHDFVLNVVAGFYNHDYSW